MADSVEDWPDLPPSLPAAVPPPTLAHANDPGTCADADALGGPARVVVDDACGFSDAWRAALPAPPASAVDFGSATSWTHVDYFAVRAARDQSGGSALPSGV